MRTGRKQLPDYWFLTLTAVLVVVGILMVFDASFPRAADGKIGDPGYFLKRQIVYSLAGFFALFLAARTRPSSFRAATNIVLGISVILLVAVMAPGLGKSINGAARWIPIGPFHLQPSELAKIAVVMYLADQFCRRRFNVRDIVALLPHVLVVGVITILVLIEPDMGTACTIVFTSAVMLYVAGTKKRHLLLMGATGVLAAVVLIAFEPYRLERVHTWLDPWSDYYGNGYQIIHSLIALGTGGIRGVGLIEGREKFYIPAPQTDMIGATLGEEAGFIGMMLLFTLFVLFTYRGISIAHKAKASYSNLLAVGLTSMISLQALMNIAVFTASMPMTGVPLPFISYGGSYLIAMLFGAGTILSVSRYSNEEMEEPEPKKRRHESSHNGRRDGRTYISCTQYRPTTRGTRRRSTVHR